MTADEDERFLSRWSRLKKEVRQAERQTESRPPEPKAATASPAVVPAKETDAAAGAQPAAAVELPPVDSLKGLASEYTEFLKPGVDESLRRSALKKLFSDPYFETFERFEAYCEDYTKGEPIPAAMLKTLQHAKGLLFDEKKEENKQGQHGVAEGGKPPLEAPPQDEAKAEAPAAPPQPEEKA
jgi:Protein of unknown function (DUF3306)